MITDIYDRIHDRILKLCPDIKEMSPGNYRKSVSSGFMDLHLDILTKEENEITIALSHTFQQNGDTIPDPDMMIRIYLIDYWRKAEALSYNDQFGYQQVYRLNDKNEMLVYPKLKTQLNAFLYQWLGNLIKQGHNLRSSN